MAVMGSFFDVIKCDKIYLLKLTDLQKDRKCNRPGKSQPSTSLKFSLATEHPVPSDCISMYELLWFCVLQVSLIITLIEIIALFYDFHLQTVLRKRRRAE
jgi:hypothetical protein